MVFMAKLVLRHLLRNFDRQYRAMSPKRKALRVVAEDTAVMIMSLLAVGYSTLSKTSQKNSKNLLHCKGTAEEVEP